MIHNAVGQAQRPLNSSFRWWHWALLMSIDMLGPFSTDSYIPNMPSLQHDLSTSYALVGLSLQLNWIVKGISTLVLGFLSDEYGRRPIVVASFIVYIFGTLVCARSPSVLVFCSGGPSRA